MFMVAFSLESDHQRGEDVTPQMLREALLQRIKDLDIYSGWIEATGAPLDTFRVTESNR